MDPHTYLRHLEADGKAVSAAAGEDPAAPVPTCPKWTLAELLAHVGSAHRWAEETVRTRATEMAPFSKPPKCFGAVLPWYAEGLDRVIQTLGAVDPDEPVWNFRDLGVGPARFWQRRMAQETAVHRWDAEHALGRPTPIDGELAADGILEYVGLSSSFLSRKPKEELGGTIGLEADDSSFALSLTLAPSEVRAREGIDGTDAVVRATSSDLYLWLLNRLTVGQGSVQAEGDPSVIEAWSHVRF